jgi:dienelactone hydrolase
MRIPTSDAMMAPLLSLAAKGPLKSVCVFVLLLVLGGSAAGGQSPPRRPAEKVLIDSPAGVTIAAEFLDAGRGSPGVLLFPMCSSIYMGGWSPVAQRLQALGVSSLAVTYRGWAGSTGAPPPQTGPPYDAATYWTETWGPDADASLAYLQTRIGVDTPIATAGASCGGHMALLTASRHPSSVRAVVTLAGPHVEAHLAYVRTHPAVAVFAAAAEGDGLFAESVRAVRAASANPSSELVLVPGRQLGVIRFGGHLSQGEYDVQTDGRHSEAASAPPVHG